MSAGKTLFMKQLILIFYAFFALAACSKNNEYPLTKGKLVYRSCATIVVQVLDSTQFSIAQSSWQQDASKPVFEHVFAVSNQCSFPTGVAIGEEISFKVVVSDPSNKDCVRCALFDNPPQKSNMIKVIGRED